MAKAKHHREVVLIAPMKIYSDEISAFQRFVKTLK